ncbi:MAG TPA: hypothetical protein DEP43_04215 [Ruminococcaceae bacterium]|nr:hypothetical protein [Oscillospiraceae bacterium]
MKYGFLFGAGAEVGYGLPSGGKFALDIFRHDVSESKKAFKEMRDNVDYTTRYASYWLPDGFRDKNISSFGKTVFQNIIKDTVEHNRENIIKRINNFDEVAKSEVSAMKRDNIDIDALLEKLIGRELDNVHMGQTISFIDEFKQGNDLFDSSYFSALLMVYKDKTIITGEQRIEFGKILLSIIQLHVGALSESLSRRINDGLFAKKDDEIDIFDDIGEIIQLNYSSSGLSGMEYLLDQREADISTDAGKCLRFAQKIIEAIYAVVLDYKTLIDANWHYLYSPSTDWAKFCKICIFLLNVRDYITKIAAGAKPEDKYGYYHVLKESIDEKKFEVSAVATTNYNRFISDILRTDVAFLNGSTEIWYDPYLNRIGTNSELTTSEKHILVPLMFTQSGTKPMTSIEMSMKYVDTYTQWKNSDRVIIVGFGFGTDDEHINGILRTLIDVDNKEITVVTLEKHQSDAAIAKDIARKLKVTNVSNISIIQVDANGENIQDKKIWTDSLCG